MKKIYLFFIINFYFISIFSFSNAQNILTPNNTNITTLSISTSTKIILPAKTYIQIIDSCTWNHSGACVAARGGPGTNFSKEHRLRNGIVLKVSEKVGNKSDIWYKIDFKNEKINKSERLKKEWYVNAKYTKVLEDVKPEVYDEGNYLENKEIENKKIYINLKKQILEAYEGETLFMRTKISTGLKDSPTESGEYFIHYKTPSRYMQDDATTTKIFYTHTKTETLASGESKISTSTRSYSTSTKNKINYKEYYDLPGVPFAMYFDEDGKAIHGAYWHNNFGSQHSHGCINLPLKDSEKLYRWTPVGAIVIVK